MKQRKTPLRTCVVTREQAEKRDLIRIVKNKDGVVSVDMTGKAHGRGAYLTLTKEIIAKAERTKALEKKLDIPIPETIYHTLYELAKQKTTT